VKSTLVAVMLMTMGLLASCTDDSHSAATVTTNAVPPTASHDPIELAQVLEVSGMPIRQITEPATLSSLPAIIEDDSSRPVSERPRTADCPLPIRVTYVSGRSERLCLWFHTDLWDKAQPLP
jgi:hypothetical protein